ncbi:MAG: hypothetical protein HN742_21465 [Lentisphaerae bacterium]|nr:hypothetical protein [Lentisphaerota bacterium]MBT4817334.1 hypothetical protein [Lentisphaerota bacterium]MBT5613097.1 hypothetical protein [Lentisphaerota bacterium]MBT7056431.1 hypothetical protein [Lentisphaerota bacterium]MBT7844460.1 hypothetical protein [Lentisphaerota bacterium]
MNHQQELIEFYRQLALLAESGLPLPEGLAGMADTCRDRAFRESIRGLERDIREGRSLSGALRGVPGVFPELYTSLLEGGERAGILPEALHEIASLAQRAAHTGLTLREALVYPAITVAFCLGTLLAMFRFVLPQLGRDLAVYYEGSVPLASKTVCGLAERVTALWPLPALVYLVIVSALVWLLSDCTPAGACLMRLARHLPGAATVTRHLDSARGCTLLAVFIRRGIPGGEMLRACATMLTADGSARRLQGLADSCDRGQALGELEGLETVFGQHAAIALRHPAEAGLAEQLERVAESERVQAELAFQRLRAAANLAAFGGMAVVGALSIWVLFLPLIQLYHSMAAEGTGW